MSSQPLELIKDSAKLTSTLSRIGRGKQRPTGHHSVVLHRGSKHWVPGIFLHSLPKWPGPQIPLAYSIIKPWRPEAALFCGVATFILFLPGSDVISLESPNAPYFQKNWLKGWRHSMLHSSASLPSVAALGEGGNHLIMHLLSQDAFTQLAILNADHSQTTLRLVNWLTVTSWLLFAPLKPHSK